MNKIIDFQSPNDSRFVGWVYSDVIVKKEFDYNIYALLFNSFQKVIVIELKNAKDNATIFNGDGSEFKRIQNPDPQAVCFGDVYYVKNEITLISRRRDASMLAVVINENGDVIRTYEAR